MTADRSFFINVRFEGCLYMPLETCKTVKYFGIDWHLKIRRRHHMYRITVVHKRMIGEWPVVARKEMFIVNKLGRSHIPRGCATVHSDFEPFTIECHVVVDQLNGYPRRPLRLFDLPIPNLTDIVLVVGTKKFHVSKVLLATHSTVFERMFFGALCEQKDEITLYDIEEEGFQDFLELLHCYNSITPHNIETMLRLSDYFDSASAKYSCEKFLTETGAVKILWKLSLSDEYRLMSLMPLCLRVLDGARSMEDIREMCPDDYTRFSEMTKNVLLKKIFTFNFVNC